jgi:prepilin-type N-terminal cleavage/methylation domain-containing protein/prepilin-type processing-associated H-X9-DG protein
MHLRTCRREGFIRRKSSGFTLIELLVVIAIISILASILFPVFAAARGKARQITCTSNMRQIGMASMLYQQDYDGYYVPKYNCSRFDATYPDHCADPQRIGENIVPPSVEWLPAAQDPPGTEYLLRPYIKNDDVRRCPARTTHPPLADGERRSEGRYVINAWDTYFARNADNGRGGKGRNETGPQGRSDAEVSEPASTVFALEHTNNASECQAGQDGESATELGAVPDHWELNHNGGFNLLWCDGHVKWTRDSHLRRSWFSIQAD